MRSKIRRQAEYTVTVQGNSFNIVEVEDALHLAKKDAERNGGRVSVHVDIRRSDESMHSTIKFLVRPR